MTPGEETYDEVDWEMEESHGYDCDCDECNLERAEMECGELPEHLGGGCSMAGSEYCEFECPFRNAVHGDAE